MKRPQLIFIIALAVYIVTAGGHLYSPDEEVLFRVTRSLATGHGGAVEPLGGFATRPPARPRTDGREFAQYGMGQPILAVPFYWVGALLGHIGSDALWQKLYGHPARGPLEWGYPASAAELAPRWACSWFNCFVGAALALLAYLIALELIGSMSAATWSAALYAFGTMAWPHTRPFFTESLATLGIALAWYALLRARGENLLGWCKLAGAAAGFAALVRLDSVLAFPALAILLLGPVAKASREEKIDPRLAWTMFCIPAAFFGCVILGFNWIHFGSFISTGYEDQPEGVAFKTPIIAGLFGFLFSAGRGLFFFSPALVLSLWGWRPLAALSRARHPSLVYAVALAVLAPLAMQSRWQNWAGGWCWGPRHIFMIHFFLALAVAGWLASTHVLTRRIVGGAVLAIAAGVQLLGCSQDFIAFYDRAFRSPGSRQGAFIVYDSIDRQFWDQYYRLQFRNHPTDPWRDVPLFPPVPIQDSLYHPQRSVWSGYPQMLDAGLIDNFWLGLLGIGAPPPTMPTSDPGTAR